MPILWREAGEFGDPAGDEGGVRILIAALLHRIVDAHGVDAGDAGLHLGLRVMDARLEIREQPAEPHRRFAPMHPEMIARRRHQHGAHAEVHPTGRPQRPHAGVDEGPSGFALVPALQPFGVRRAVADRVIGGMLVFELQPRFAFELLHEMAAPVQPAFERFERAGMRRMRVPPQAPHAVLGRPERLRRLAARQRSPGEMRRQARAGRPGGDRARHRPAIIDAAIFEKPVEQRDRLRPSAGLPVGTGIGVEAEIGGGRRDAGIAIRDRGERIRRGDDRFRHEGVPALRPSVARADRADHPALPTFDPFDADIPRPGGDALVPRIGPGAAGLLMAEQRRHAVRAAQRLKRRDGVADADDQRLAHRGQRGAQIFDAVDEKAVLAGRNVGEPPIVGLDDQNGQRRPRRRRFGQGGVIDRPQIAFEPDRSHIRDLTASAVASL